MESNQTKYTVYAGAAILGALAVYYLTRPSVKAEEKVKQKCGRVFIIGNPLLDISIEIKPDDTLLKKYDLKWGNASLSEHKQEPLFHEIWDN